MKRLLGLACFVFLLILSSAEDLAAQDLVIINARIVVGTGATIDRGSIVVRGGRIVSVAAGSATASGAPVIDARGMTALPGFIDGHRHIMGGNDEQWFKTQSVTRMQEFLDAGYTTLMSGGGPVPGILELKRRVDTGALKGPRIITSGRVDPDNFKTEELARDQVRKYAAAGIEIIKARIDPEPTPAQKTILAAVIDEGRKVKLDVMVHAASVPAMLAALDAGAQKLVHTPHGSWLSEADARKVAAAGVETLSTAGFGLPVFGVFNTQNIPTFRDGSKWPEGILDGKGRGREAGEKAVNGRTLFDAGVTYGFGTDTNYLPREGLEHELRALSLMFSAQDIIKVMGPNSAAFIEKSTDLGTLEPGKLADIVLVEGDPLDLIYNLLNVKVVTKGGAVVVDKRP
jgi:imidazolonepropionase-like amidohydrolase